MHLRSRRRVKDKGKRIAREEFLIVAAAVKVGFDPVVVGVFRTEADAEQLESITYESYGPGGSALIIEALTSNRNKAAQEIKFILGKHGFQLAAPHAASWAFTKEHDPSTSLGASWIPNTTIPLSPEDENILEKLIEELEDNDEVQEVYTNAE